MKRAYPVIFTENEGTILIEVPDMEILTQSKNLVEAIEMARDAIGIKGISMEDDKMQIPEPTHILSIDISKGSFSEIGKSHVSLVDVDFISYRKRNDNKMVRRNVTLPNWLNLEAEKQHVNVSKILQEALIAKLEVENIIR